MEMVQNLFKQLVTVQRQLTYIMNVPAWYKYKIRNIHIWTPRNYAQKFWKLHHTKILQISAHIPTYYAGHFMMIPNE